MGMETHGRAHSPLGPAQDRPHQSPSQAAAAAATATGRLPRRRAAALGAAAAAGRGRGGGGGGQDEVQPERALKRLKGFFCCAFSFVRICCHKQPREAKLAHPKISKDV